jgi:hypothetical protein
MTGPTIGEIMPESLKLLIQAGHPIISIQSTDESRVLGLVHETSRELSRSIMEWSMTQGLVPFDGQGIRRSPVVQPSSATEALAHVQDCIGSFVFIFRDLGVHGNRRKKHSPSRHVRRANSP